MRFKEIIIIYTEIHKNTNNIKSYLFIGKEGGIHMYTITGLSMFNSSLYNYKLFWILQTLK
jgi:hypothetical protein